MDIKVSVIVPIYNTERYIGKCLESCVNQTLDGIEIIIINDGSTDNSLHIINEYVNKYENIIVKSIENSGLSVARNTGLALSKGKYVYFCDSDDWIEPYCLEEAFLYAEKYGLEIVTLDADVISDVSISELTNYSYSRFDRIDASQIYTGKEFVEKYQEIELVTAWLHFIKREFLERNQIVFLPNVIYEDNKFFMDCMSHAVRIRYLPHKLYHYCIRQDSIMTSPITIRKLESPYDLCIGMLETVEKLQVKEKEKRFWLDYICHKIKNLSFISYFKPAKELTDLICGHYEKVEDKQYRFLRKYWETLKRVCFDPKSLFSFLRCMENALCLTGTLSDREEKLIDEVFSYHEKYICGELEKLPFSDETKKIGIYGIGKHTRGLLKNYEYIVGKIKCQIVYIDSNIISYTQRRDNTDIINICDAASAELDEIVISSYLYEQELFVKAKNALGNNILIYKIYDGKKYWLDAEFDRENLIKERLLAHKRNICDKNFFLIATPEHTNTGDYLISVAEKIYLKKFFPNSKVIEVTGQAFMENRNNIIGQISRLDTLLITGGGFFGSLWPDGEVLERVLEYFPDNKVVILPQSLYYEDNPYGLARQKKICLIAKNHRDLVICYREQISLKKGLELFGENIRQYVFPDMTLFLHGIEYYGKRKGISLCLRNDIESVLTDEQKHQIMNLAEAEGETISLISMHWNTVIEKEKRDEILQKKLDEIASAKLVIADALHCVISCALTGTPCIALPSSTRKTEGVFQWIKELPYIKYIDADTNSDYIRLIKQNLKELLSKEDNYEKYSYNIDFRSYENLLTELINF